MTYKEARVYLDELSKYGSVLGLDTIRGLLRELGNPQDDLRFIHIAGTNGKGSVLAYTSTILSEAGYRVGRYVSPTVISYLERIQVDGVWISEQRFADITAQVRDAIARLEEAKEPLPTVFEAETAIAFLYFKEMNCRIVVLEAGLGGALDATNIIKNTMCAVFSSISRDHIGIIGDTTEEIAQNKAGIIKPGCTVVSAEQLLSVTAVLRQRAEEYGCAFIQADSHLAEISESGFRGTCLSYKEFNNIRTHLAGSFQASNLVTALEVIRALRLQGYSISDEAVRSGAEHTVWPGRFTCIGENPVFILDGAHNEDAALRLKESVSNYFPGRKLICIMGVFRDKDYEKIAEIMCPLASFIYTVELPDKKRGLPATELADAVHPYCPHVTAYASNPHGTGQADGIRRAVNGALEKASSDDVILAFGSLSYLHQVKEAYGQNTRNSNAQFTKERGRSFYDRSEEN